MITALSASLIANMVLLVALGRQQVLLEHTPHMTPHTPPPFFSRLPLYAWAVVLILGGIATATAAHLAGEACYWLGSALGIFP